MRRAWNAYMDWQMVDGKPTRLNLAIGITLWIGTFVLILC